MDAKRRHSHLGKLKRQQAIRLKNTLLAAAGGVIFTCMLLVGHSTQALLLSGTWLAAYLGLLWLGNFAIIGAIVSGFNLRFRDPALSLVQMYWAITITVLALLLSNKLDIGVYLLILVILVFGIFRVSVRQFNVICAYAIVAMLVAHGLRLLLLEPQANLTLVFVQWVVFSFCTFTLTRLCQSIVTLRNRLREKNEQLQEALDAKQQFLANMSHEIRTPMNGVLGMLDIVMGEDMPGKQRRYLGIAQSSATSLLAVINDILDFSKMEAGKLKIEPVVFDLEQLIREVIDTFNAKAEAKGLEMVLDIPQDMPTRIITDPQRLRQILNNLLGNALKFTEKGEVVVAVALERPNEAEGEAEQLGQPYMLRWRVSDTGIGVDGDIVERLFDSFTQADSSTTRSYGGAGLGLAICKQLCLLLGGDISVRSTMGEGSCFEFAIPVEIPVGGVDAAALDLSVIRGVRVLLVDDNSASLRILQRQLEQAGAQVTAADSAAAAIGLLQREEVSRAGFDVALLDMQMPDTNGLVLAQNIHTMPGFDNLALIMLITTIDEISEDRLRELGIAQCVHKPVMPQRLYAALARALNAPLPLPAADDPPRSPKRAQPGPPGTLGTTVLLVEDNSTNQQVAALTLTELGYRVAIANNGRAAVNAVANAIVQDVGYDLILMDCQMPVLDGYEATRQIRQLPIARWAEVPIIAMTANAMPGDREKCLAAGMDDYIAKPFQLDLLQQKLASWLRRDNGADEAVQEPEVIKKAQDQALVWDQAALEKLARHKEERMTHLIGSFLSEIGATGEAIVEALESHQNERAEKLIHGLRGASANLGARALPALLLEAETQLRDNPEVTLPESLVSRVNEQIAALRWELQAYLAAKRPGA